MNLIKILQETHKYKKDPNEKVILDSIAHGPVMLVGFQNDQIMTIDQSRASIVFDKEGKIHPKGQCILFPGTGEQWEAWRKRLCDEFYDSMLRIGDVCLAKKDHNSDWTLAIYEGKFNGKYLARTGTEKLEWEYCISFAENSGYLGRPSFPDWMLTEEDLA